MRGMLARSRWLSVLGFVAVSGCDSLFGGDDPKVSLTPSTTNVSLAQGGSTDVTLTIGRSHYTKNVVLAVEGGTSGITTTVSMSVVDNSVPDVTLHIVAAGVTPPGDYTVTVRATGEGIDEQSVSIDVAVAVTGSFGLGMLEQSINVAQGGAGTATVLVSRFQNNAGNVTLVASGVPAGVTATITPSPTTTASATIGFTATAGAAVGSFPISVVASQPGFPDQNTSFSLVISAPTPTASVSVPFCATDMPAWFGYRNEGFGWQRVTPSGNSFTFNATDRVTIAFAYPSTFENQVQIFSAARAELAAGTAGDCDGSKSMSGTVAGLGTGQSAFVNLGAATAQLSTTSTANYTLANVPNGAFDLVAIRGGFVGSTQYFRPDAIVVRRAQDLANGSTIAPIDFGGAEAFAPATSSISVSGLQPADQVDLQNTFWSVTSTYASMQFDDASPASLTLYSVPADKLVAGDLHELYVDAYTQTSASLAGHSFAAYFFAPTDRTDAVGPLLTVPTINTVTASPYARPRGRLVSQPEYNTSVQFGFFQSPASGADRYVVVTMSAAYLGGTPTQWDVVIPDLNGTPGFDATWMNIPNEPTGYFAQAFSGRTELLLGARPASGDLVHFAYRVGTIFTTQLRAAALRAESARRLTPPRQYFRR